VKKLYLLRHAKSDYNNNVDDHDRPLNKRGEKSCRIIGEYIKKHDIAPQIILCSDAIRTMLTAKNIVRECGIDTNITFTKQLYLATAGEILKVIARIDNTVDSAMVVCHNPGVENLAKFLLEDGNNDSIHRLKTKYSTCGLACFTLQTDNWAEINPQSGYLDYFATPKTLETA
jgi:phosphohistidine phosphatase